MYKGEVGWDLPERGDLKNLKPPSGNTVAQDLQWCAKYCDREAGCTIFTYYGDKCYLKKDVLATPVFLGKGKSGWRKMYVEQKGN